MTWLLVNSQQWWLPEHELHKTKSTKHSVMDRGGAHKILPFQGSYGQLKVAEEDGKDRVHISQYCSY